MINDFYYKILCNFFRMIHTIFLLISEIYLYSYLYLFDIRSVSDIR
jgi:hypothetical protein